jgi:hypothetical protein
MLAPPTAIYALGPGLTKKYVDMTFFRRLTCDIQLHIYAVHINRDLDDKLHPQKCSVDTTANAAER